MPYKDREAQLAYFREYRKKNRDRRVAQINAWKRREYATNPEYREKVKAAMRAVPKHVQAARYQVRKAIREGRLVRPDRCETCGRSPIFCEAAHDDYSRPLDVKWLCRSCHRKYDAPGKGKIEKPATV